MLDRGNIFSKIPTDIPDEIFENVIARQSLRIERIISKRHSTPKGTWLCQNQHEWVMLLRGSAGLLFEDVDELIVLNTGDYVTITAHTKHRVEWTDNTQETIWLAVHFD